MTNDQLMAAFTANFAELHAKVDALPDAPGKVEAQRLASMFHHAGNVFAAHVSDMGEVQPFDGTNKP
jgi:hypothetical protein